MWLKRKRNVKCSEIILGRHLFKAGICANIVEIFSIIWRRLPKKTSLHIIAMEASNYTKAIILGYFIQELKQLTLALIRYPSAIW